MAKKTRFRRQRWKADDVFLIPLKDGTYVVGQVLGTERDAMDSAGVALFDLRIKTESDAKQIDVLDKDDVFAILLVTRDLLSKGIWPIIGHLPKGVPTRMIPYEKFRKLDWVGATITGSGIVNEFVNAFYGFEPWDAWHDPNYLDTLLISPDKRPRKLVFQNRKNGGKK